MRRLRILGVVSAVAAVIAGVQVAEVASEWNIAGRWDVAWLRPSSVSADGTMRVEDAAVKAGLPLNVTFAGGDIRGVAYELTPIRVNGPASEYTLLSDKNPSGPGAYGDGDVVLIDFLGLSGPGPDIVPTPADAPPGRYRLCVRDDPRCVSVVLT